MSRLLSRRKALGLGAAAGTAFLGAWTTAKAEKPRPQFPWPYPGLKVEKTQNLAYGSYFKGGCMYGVFNAIAGQAAEGLGPPYTDFPFELSTYGGGGIALWGTLCGSCNGAAMAISMFHQGRVRNQIISEVFAWYERTQLPVYRPEIPRQVKADFSMPASQSNSTLCHVSITRWVNRAGSDPFSPQRVERCARLVADVAGFTTSLLNQDREQKFKPDRQISEQANACLKCHGHKEKHGEEPEVVSRMSCTTCHEPHG